MSKDPLTTLFGMAGQSDRKIVESAFCLLSLSILTFPDLVSLPFHLISDMISSVSILEESDSQSQEWFVFLLNTNMIYSNPTRSWKIRWKSHPLLLS